MDNKQIFREDVKFISNLIMLLLIGVNICFDLVGIWSTITYILIIILSSIISYCCYKDIQINIAIIYGIITIISVFKVIS